MMQNEEHKLITEKTLELFSQFEKLHQTFQYEEIESSEHREYITWINHQIVSLSDAFILLQENSYKSIFSLIRNVFEAYWVIELTMNGIKYCIEYPPREGQNIQRRFQRLKGNFEANKLEMIKKGILEIKHPKNNKIKVIYSGFKDKDGNIIPKYYFLFKDYNPEIANVGLEEPYSENDDLDKARENTMNVHKDLKWFFQFGRGIKNNLLLNDLVTEDEFERIKVHYNFLSMWTHPSMNSISLIQNNIHGYGDLKKIRKYDFFLTRLALLYIGNIMCLYLNSFLKVSKRQIAEKKIISIKHKSEFEKAISDFLELTDYFWFIYNEPHYYYKWKYGIKLIGKKSVDEINKIKISELKANEIEYYKNPVVTLKDLSISLDNKIIGKYESPIEKELLNLEVRK